MLTVTFICFIRCLSFAKYLELRFHGHAYKRRIVDTTDSKQNSDETLSLDLEHNKAKCTHSLHKDHVQYFSYNGIVASFMYTPIEVWEIGLPSLILTLKKLKPIENTAPFVDDIKNFALQGYDVYAKIFDKLAQFCNDGEFPLLNSLKKQANRDQSHFRDKVGIVQTLLTEPGLNPYDISDAMLIAKRVLAETIEQWMPKLHEAATQSRTNFAAKQEVPLVVDSGTICTEDLRPDSDPLVHDVEVPSDPPEVHRRNSKQDNVDVREKTSSSPMDSSPNKQSMESPPSKDVNDKKSVKTLLRELLPLDKSLYTLTSPLSINEHHTLPVGQFPVLVHDQDHSSIIAYALVSSDYKRLLDGQHCGYSSDTNSSNSPNVKRKSQDGSIDSDDKESVRENDKKTKCDLHVELSFHDVSTQFTCKIYFAKDFDSMRVNFIKNDKHDRPASTKDGENLDEKRNVHRMQTFSDSDMKTCKEFERLERMSSSSSLTPNHRCSTDSRDPTIQQDIDEVRSSFARSLSHSVRWEARGGKSGSKFCKTLGELKILSYKINMYKFHFFCVRRSIRSERDV